MYFHTVKISALFILLIICSCSLSSSQKKELNQALNEYIYARNNNVLSSIEEYTYPKIVSFYNNNGDSSFVKKYDFDLKDRDVTFRDGIIRELQEERDIIHVKYNFQRVEVSVEGASTSPTFIYALSEDSGKSWFFLDEEDYLNDEIVPLTKRLIL